MSDTTVLAAIQGYLDHLWIERGLSANSIAAYRRDLTRYRTYMELLGRQRPSEITADDVSNFVIWLSQPVADSPQLARASISRICSAVRGAHRFWLAEGYVPVDVSADIAVATPNRSLPKALAVGDVLAILAAPSVDEAAGLRDRALLEFLYGTGARVSEAVQLSLADLDLDARQVSLHGKGGKQRLLPLGNHAIAAMEAYLVRARPDFASKRMEPATAVFLNQRGGPLSRQSAWNIIRQAASNAGLSDQISPHVLRHSFATHLLDGGADIRVVQELLGHASVTTTQIYTLVTIDKLREVYLTSHPRALA